MKRKEIIADIIIGVTIMIILLSSLLLAFVTNNTSKERYSVEPIEGKHFIYDSLGDSIWLKYDTVIRKSYTKDKPKKLLTL